MISKVLLQEARQIIRDRGYRITRTRSNMVEGEGCGCGSGCGCEPCKDKEGRKELTDMKGLKDRLKKRRAYYQVMRKKYV